MFWLKTVFAIVLAVGIGIAMNNIALAAAALAILSIAAWAPLYMRYAHDNPNHLWFKRKLFGWGWTPVTWQGWFVVAAYLVLVAFFGLTIDKDSPPREIAFTFILPVAVLTTLLIRIAYQKGEKPRWQWGKELRKYE